jgi:hypothetical protein
MTLHEIIQSLESHPEGTTIFAERINGEFRPESRAVLIEMTMTSFRCQFKTLLPVEHLGLIIF